MGDGEVALTAMEGSLRATFRLTVCKPGSGDAPSVAYRYPFDETGRRARVDPESALRLTVHAAGWQVGHQNRLRARCVSCAIGVPHTRQGRPVRR